MALLSNGIVHIRIGRSDHNLVYQSGSPQTTDDPSENTLSAQIHQHFAWQASASHSSLDDANGFHPVFGCNAYLDDP